MTNNERIAHQYAKLMAASCNKLWVSDNLPQLSRRDRRDVLAIYKQYFHTVDYDAKTGICRCWVDQPEILGSDTTWGKFNSVDARTGVRGTEIREETLKATGGTGAVDAGTIIVEE